ncbi:MAG TPA: Calx-beta domain-containing protein [Solirubrobacteraceae bacterium]|nr:Calx-beta domain-containing protein [Solirubrobacteraceae bacterium]
MGNGRKPSGRTSCIGLAATLLLSLLLASTAHATIFSVTTNADSGAGTLRQAIIDANTTTGSDVIDFNLLAATTITPSSPLPTITDPVTIDGTTASGYFGNPVIDLTGGGAGAGADGLTLGAGSGGSDVRAIAVSGFDGAGIRIASTGNTIENDFIGVDSSFNPAGNNGDGIAIVSGADNTTIGGVAGEMLIENNGGAGISIAASGTNVDGTNSTTIDGNTGAGIAITGNGTTVANHNIIGDFGLANGGGGVTISGSNNTIGGDAGTGNLITNNTGAGVRVTAGTDNRITSDTIASNSALGIDLGPAGVTANDPAPDSDTGANDLQNFPVLDTYSPGASSTTVGGTLDSAASTQFRIDVYGVSECDPSGNGQGDDPVDSFNVTTNGSGHVAFSQSLPEAITERFITVTATDPNGNTSEFSACKAGPPTGAVVTNGTVMLGVNRTGDLNYSCVQGEQNCPGDSAAGTGPVGLRINSLNLDSTAPGCPCEGWGIADAGTSFSGYADESTGTANVTVNSFTITSTSAVSDVTISDPAKPNEEMHVVQDYHPSAASPNLYEDTVTVTNSGTTAFTDLRYRRAMDWDIEPTAFSEWTTIHGTSPQLLFDSDDGFATADPLAGPSYIDSPSVCGAGYTGPCQFTDLGTGGEFGGTATGPDDHGALFDFGFGALASGASKTFKVYYGAALNETAAINALNTGGAQVYSLGESNCPDGPAIAGCDGLTAGAGPQLGEPATFMFGFVTTTGDLSITKTDSPDPVRVGEHLTYTLTVANNGPEAAAGVQVSDPLPANTTFVSATPSQGTCSGTSTVSCNLGAIANSGTATVTIVVTPTQTGTLTNTATVSSASADANPANNSSTATTTVDPDVPSASVDDVSHSEGTGGSTTTYTFHVTLDKTSASTVTIDYATADGASTDHANHTLGDPDYQSASNTLTFNPGETSKTVDVLVNQDAVYEHDETFVLNLSNPTNAIIGDSQGVGTIVNDDAAPVVAITDATKNPEGNSGTSNLGFTVTLTGATEVPATVHYATSDGTATAPADYTAGSGTLTFNPGETSKTINVPIVGDTLDENDETFTVTLSSPVDATLDPSHTAATGTIVDDDSPPAVSIANGSVTEGNSGTTNLPLTVTLSAPSGKTVTVSYATADGTATAPADYTATSGTLTFNPGETSKTIDVPVVGDTLVEGDETFSVTLSSPANASIATGTGTATIVDDDAPVVTNPANLSVGDASVKEGDTGTTPAPFTVTLSAASLSPVTVHYATADGTAHAPADYTATSGTLTFNPGETSKTIDVPVAGDTLVEGDETFTLNLSSPSNAGISDGSGTGTILDDDAALPPLSGPGSGHFGDLFCGVQHRGKCTGIPFKESYPGPGDAAWVFGAYNPAPGKPHAAAAPRRFFRFGVVHVHVKKAGAIVTRLRVVGSHALRFYHFMKKHHLTTVSVTVTFTGTDGKHATQTKNVRLKR